MRHFCLALTVLAFLLSTGDAQSCEVYSQNFSVGFRNDLNLDYNDYGAIHLDAGNSSCAETAQWALYWKLKNTLDTPTHVDSEGSRVGPFSGWLEGAHISLAFAAALQIGAQGWGSKELDEQLQRAAAAYQTKTPAYGCGHPTSSTLGTLGNTCMDDWSVAASAWAWIAAYQDRRDYSYWEVSTLQNRARAYINAALSTSDSICIHNPSTFDGTILCNGTDAQLAAGTAKTLSLNHDQQHIGYGFGLMAMIASAVKGLEVSGTSMTFQPAEAARAIALFEEAQQHYDAGVFKADCVKIGKVNGLLAITGTAERCGGPAAGTPEFFPNMYSLYTFYMRQIGSVPSGAYMSRTPDPGYYNNAFFGPARLSHNLYHGGYWQDAGWSDANFMPHDYSNPIGFFSGIEVDGTGAWAFGWTCDPDRPNDSNMVSILADNALYTTVRADVPSESGVNMACGGGFAHRFRVYLDWSTRGKTISAFGLDYTWYGFTELPLYPQYAPTSWW